MVENESRKERLEQTGSNTQVGSSAKTGRSVQAGSNVQTSSNAQAGSGAQAGGGAQTSSNVQMGISVQACRSAQTGSSAQAGRRSGRKILGPGRLKIGAGKIGLRKAGRLSNRISGDIYYVDARTSRKILTNEWDKRIYLNALEEVRELFQTRLFGFCLLDDRLRLLAGGKNVNRQTIRQLLSASFSIFERNTSLSGESGVVPDGTTMRVNIVRIENEKDALLVLRYIHLTPASERYILCAQDYWWSSNNTYRGHDSWPMLDIRPAMQYFKKNDPRALHSISEFHRQGEAMQNQIPDCIRKGLYEQLFISGKSVPLSENGDEDGLVLDGKA